MSARDIFKIFYYYNYNINGTKRIKRHCKNDNQDTALDSPTRTISLQGVEVFLMQTRTCQVSCIIFSRHCHQILQCFNQKRPPEARLLCLYTSVETYQYLCYFLTLVAFITGQLFTYHVTSSFHVHGLRVFLENVCSAQTDIGYRNTNTGHF